MALRFARTGGPPVPTSGRMRCSSLRNALLPGNPAKPNAGSEAGLDVVEDRPRNHLVAEESDPDLHLGEVVADAGEDDLHLLVIARAGGDGGLEGVLGFLDLRKTRSESSALFAAWSELSMPLSSGASSSPGCRLPPRHRRRRRPRQSIPCPEGAWRRARIRRAVVRERCGLSCGSYPRSDRARSGEVPKFARAHGKLAGALGGI